MTSTSTAARLFWSAGWIPWIVYPLWHVGRLRANISGGELKVDLLQRYYEQLWNRWNFDLADELLTEDFVFRGSLGNEIRGREAFKNYMRLVQSAFSDFHNDIEQSISSPPFLIARLRYSATHDGVLLGLQPTQKSVTYPGIAIFRVAKEQLAEGYVVGDRLTLFEQILGPRFWSHQPPAISSAESLTGLHVRPAVDGDVRWCAELMAGSEPWITLRRDLATALAHLGDRNKELYVAGQGEHRLGFVLLEMRGAFVGYIQSVGILPETRNRRIGAALLQFAEERIFKEQPNVFLCVSSFNIDAQRFYARHGYQKVGELPDFIIPGASEILLRKTLGPKTKFASRR
jgi:[ribosomal protein S18]-alanine N-acetyltransferase